jgi:hypothetical protein
MIPDDLLGLTAACEANYANARRRGYAKSPDVIAAVAVLKSAYAALAAANDNLQVTKGLFGMTVATLRAHRACRATRKACINLPCGNRASLDGKSFTQSVLDAA